MFAIDLGNGLTLEGEVKAGLRVKTADDSVALFDPDGFDFNNMPKKAKVDQADDSGDTRISLWNNDADRALRTRLTLNYDGELAGAKIRLNSDDATTPVLDRAYGWANFLDKKVVVYGGKIGDDLWGLGKLSINAFDPSLDGITGVRAAFNIVDGLSFGFGLPLDQITYESYDKSATKGVWEDTSGKKPGETGFDADDAEWKYENDYAWTPHLANRDLGAIFGGAVFGGVYHAPSGLFGVAAALRLSPAIDSQAYGGAYGPWKKDDGTTDVNKKVYRKKDSYVEAILGAEVHPIDPLKVGIDAQIDTRTYNHEKQEVYNVLDNKIGYTLIGVKGEYTVIPALTAYLKFDVLIQNDSAERYTKDDTHDPFAQYYSIKPDGTDGVKVGGKCG
ncbi:MAG: hypothetical protein LBT00_03420 [Spirochaetaceae bacterium]|jgi:hypothetical protein|nr:hypothetical protein [Spirochaetaceae bacterium]